MPRRDFTPLTKLQDEDPAIFIRLLRLLWPDVRAALDKGHTIRLIRQRLGEAGISISYRQLCRYVARLRREEEESETQGTGASCERPMPADAVTSEAMQDPLAQIRERLIRERPGVGDYGEPSESRADRMASLQQEPRVRWLLESGAHAARVRRQDGRRESD